MEKTVGNMSECDYQDVDHAAICEAFGGGIFVACVVVDDGVLVACGGNFFWRAF